MPSGVYKRTKAHCNSARKNSLLRKDTAHTQSTKDKISKALIGNINGHGTLGTKRMFTSDIARRNLSLAGCGRIISKRIRNKTSKTLMGHKVSLKTRRKISRHHIITGCSSMENNSAWCGGISFLPYTSEFNKHLKRRIRKRDKNICQLCCKRKYGVELAVHHIDYNKKNCKENNLIALHRSCNCNVNANRDYWYAYFKYIIKARRGGDDNE